MNLRQLNNTRFAFSFWWLELFRGFPVAKNTPYFVYFIRHEMYWWECTLKCIESMLNRFDCVVICASVFEMVYTCLRWDAFFGNNKTEVRLRLVCIVGKSVWNSTKLSFDWFKQYAKLALLKDPFILQCAWMQITSAQSTASWNN